MENLVDLVGAAGTAAEPALRVFLEKVIPAAIHPAQIPAAAAARVAQGRLPAHQVRADRQQAWVRALLIPLAGLP
jgi:hypothetical protein